ncbi:helix-turn-helix domain-containing protein [Ruminococcaceae bacterium OttesenSCG-928-L11]|nr:helix-turn-helix domain-containing protein [Ruminococcaceae bacterium OttesenSCG-928-L11]
MEHAVDIQAEKGKRSAKQKRSGTGEHHFFRYYKTFFVYVLLMVIPVLLVSVINFITIRDQNYRLLENSIQAESQKRLERFSLNLQDMSKAVSGFRGNKYFFHHYQSDAPFSYMDIKAELSSVTFWTSLYQGVYFYDAVNDVFISSKGTESREYFLGAKMKTSTPVVFSEFDDRDKTFLHTVSDTAKTKAVVIVAPFERDYGTGAAKSYFLFFIDDIIMQEAVSPELAGGDSVVTLYYRDQPIYSSDATANSYIYKKQYERLEEHSGENIQYSYSHNDITLRWSIPGTIYNNSLFSLVTRQAVVTLLLISLVTAALFLFVQKEYKPLMTIMDRFPGQSSSKRLRNEFVHLDFMLNDVFYSRNILQETNDQLKKEKFLYMLLGNKVKRFSHLYGTILDNGIRIDRERFVCVMIHDRPSNMQTFLYIKEELGLRYQNLDVYELYIAENRYVFLICTDLPVETLQEILGEIAAGGNGNRELIGVGGIVEEPDRIADTYRLAVYSPGTGDPLGARASGERLFPEVELEALAEGVAVENDVKIKASLKMIREGLIYYNEFTRMYLMVKITAIFNHEDEMAAIKKFDTADSHTVEDVDSFLTQTYKSYVHSRQQTQRKEGAAPRQSRKISHICRYIEGNYMSPSFSIKAMADVFDTSASNLSHYFKKSTGQTLSQYIDQVRIREAVKLLGDPANKVADIALRLGYVNTSSFIEIFKKYMGTTPKAYQKQMRELP